MEDKNISPERRTPRILKGVPLWLRVSLIIGLIIGMFVVLSAGLIILNPSFVIKVFGISYLALSKIMRMVGTIIYVGLLGYFLKGLIKESMDKKLTFWQKIVKWNFIILVAGTISLIIVVNNWLSFSSDLMRVLSIILSTIIFISVTIILIYYLFSKEGPLFK